MLPLIFPLSRRMGRALASVFAAVSFFLVPRQFFHSAPRGSFDVPIVTAWVFTVYCFVTGARAAAVVDLTGLAFGLALGAKHNAYFIVVTLIPFILYRGWQVTKGAGEARWLFFAINGTFVFRCGAVRLMVVAMGGGRCSRLTFQSPQLGLYP